MKKTRNQRKREKEEFYFMLAVAAWVVSMVAIIIYKAVTG